MKSSIFIALAIGVALMWCTATQAADLNMKDGLWEITTKTEMKGMPGMNVPPQVMKQCMTKKDSVPQQGPKEKNPNCKITENNTTGNTVSMVMVCKEKDMTSEMRTNLTYRGESFDGTSVMTMKDKSGKTQQINTKMSGKRLGPCDKK